MSLCVKIVMEDEERPELATTYISTYPVGDCEVNVLLDWARQIILLNLTELHRLRMVA